MHKVFLKFTQAFAKNILMEVFPAAIFIFLARATYAWVISSYFWLSVIYLVKVA